MKSIKFHPKAELEMIEAASFYEEKQRLLGKRFLQAVEQPLNKISLNPQIYKTIEKNTRWCRINTFPFSVIFREQAESIEIIAVMHIRKRPGYWKERH